MIFVNFGLYTTSVVQLMVRSQIYFAVPNFCTFMFRRQNRDSLLFWRPFRLQLQQSVSVAWWRLQMETFSALLAICAGNSPIAVNSPHKGQWRGALMFSLLCVWINGWVNNREACDLRRYRAHCDVTVMGHQVKHPLPHLLFLTWRLIGQWISLLGPVSI